MRLSRDRGEQSSEQWTWGSETAMGWRDNVMGNRENDMAKRDNVTGKRDNVMRKQDNVTGKRDSVMGKRDNVMGKRDSVMGKRDNVFSATKGAFQPQLATKPSAKTEDKISYLLDGVLLFLE